MLNHIDSYPIELIHHFGKKVKYLNGQLSIKIMYNLFKANYSNVRVRYTSYFNFLRQF